MGKSKRDERRERKGRAGREGGRKTEPQTFKEDKMAAQERIGGTGRHSRRGELRAERNNHKEQLVMREVLLTSAFKMVEDIKGN
ncbi:hypothetical protein E2C01_090342 [Portunus trituberculatus]|uniref:Uncharacterized protein n=1 Tax=Portunus trituberculatus TaxID=210409 RepID=A0A5B7JKM4_PORTR|nr:hypothetical protein [Portunus trituberculatus]